MTKQTSKGKRTNTTKRKTLTKRKTEPKIKNTIVFDLETKTLIPKGVSDEEEKKEEIRKLRISVLCSFDYKTNEYSFYTEKNIKDFLDRLKEAEKIVGYNIIAFDYLVLEKYGLAKSSIPADKTIDIFDIIRRDTGEWLRLDTLSKVNLGRGKLVKGKDMVNADPVTLYEGCKEDVSITKELFELFLKGKLKYKHLKGRRPQINFVDDDYIEIGDGAGYVPPEIKCPKCGSRNFEKFDELSDGQGIDEMTEGQFAEYIAGTWGTLECLDCGESFDYEI
jgi:predicted nucleic-acid-binding Zn-ribbon protein